MAGKWRGLRWKGGVTVHYNFSCSCNNANTDASGSKVMEEEAVGEG